MIKIFFSIFLSIITLFGFSQKPLMYKSEMLDFKSEVIGENFAIDLMIPLSFSRSSALAKYPLIILFDSHNENTHRYNLHSIDIMTYHAQMPEAAVAGIPFSMANRYYLTSMTCKDGEEVAGISKMATFIFDELIPALAKDYKVARPFLFIGHSRTAFLTSYLMVSRGDDFDAAGSFSGFLGKGFTLAELDGFLPKAKAGNHDFHYYFSVGTDSKEEEVYYNDLLQIEEFLATRDDHSGFQWSFLRNPHAGHMMNYNLSVPQMLNGYFGNYSAVLTDWLFEKLNSNFEFDPIDDLKADFKQLSAFYGDGIQPGGVHFISFGNAFLNTGEYQAALDILNYGLELYPADYDINYLAAICLMEMGSADEAKAIALQNLEWLANDGEIDGLAKLELIEMFSELSE